MTLEPSPLTDFEPAPPELKRRRGRPKGARNKPKKAVPTPPIKTEEDVDYSDALEWAQAVMWAARNTHVKKMTKRKAGNDMRYNYWQLGQDNQKQLLVDLAPKAAAIIDKAKGQGDETGIVLAEEKEIDELQKLLSQARMEAGV